MSSAQQRALISNPTAHSRPLDLAQLEQRLRQVSADDSNAPARSRPRTIDRSRSPTPFIDQDACLRERETDAYNALIKDGGRPLYPICLLDEMLRHPENHEQLLRPWQDNFGDTNKYWSDKHSTTSPTDIFQRQLSRWCDFRDWQRDNRWLEDDDGGYPAYVESWKQHVARHFTRRGAIQELAEIEADPSSLKDVWNMRQRDRQLQRNYCKEFHGGDKFADYVDAVNRRLAQHDFTYPFQLKEDPGQQDKLATWIEYLNFEYWWLDQYTDTIERLKPHADKAWQKLVDSKVLRPGETRESVRSSSSLNRQQNEQDRAFKAVQRAAAQGRQVYTSTQIDPSRVNIPQEERIRRINEALREYIRAQDRLDSIKRRNDCIGEFVGDTVHLKLAKRDAARHRTLIPWILEQVPLVEAELNHTNSIGTGSVGIKRSKRRLDSDDDTPQQRVRKKQKLGLIDKGSAFSAEGNQAYEEVSSPIVENVSPPQQEKIHQRVRAVATKHFSRNLASQGLRRSARIAAAATDRRNGSAASTCLKSSGTERLVQSRATSTAQSTKKYTEA